MAFGRIEITAGWATSQKADAVKLVAKAISDALRVPPDDPTVVLVEHPPANIVVPMHAGTGYTIVSVTMFAGRSEEAKRRLIRAITDAVLTAGPGGVVVDVLLQEQPRGHWARDGDVASDRDPDFEIEI
jgi:phenylpyruvate tautomerase PptA (4-oxalocrotonate tautomerase family)